MADSAPPAVRPTTGRPRAPSFSDAISQVPQNANTQDEAAANPTALTHQEPEPEPEPASYAQVAAKRVAPTPDAKKPNASASHDDDERYKSQGLLKDILNFRWMTAPTSSARLVSIFVLSYINWNLFMPKDENPFRPFLFISHQVPQSEVIVTSAKPYTQLQRSIQSLWPSSGSGSGETGLVRYQKGYDDLCFLVFYVIVFSLIRQTSTLYVFKPFAKWWGIKPESKQERFTEQGYAVLYWGTAAAFGLYVMSFQDSWWFELEHLWLRYPHWQMRPELKTYYLLQFAYWLQQALVMLLRLEKPRKDYYELIAHHLVTLWLIGWSYLINLTMIGTTVFVCMDIPDTWLGLSKSLNYMGLDKLTTGIFIVFMAIWTYFRIYLSALTLWSVWFEFDLIPEYAKEWNPEQGWWLVYWMKYHVFGPLFLLLLLNLFWYVLMWRIMFRALKGDVSDEREDGEYDEQEDKKKQ